jgi:hypothetical protein
MPKLIPASALFPSREFEYVLANSFVTPSVAVIKIGENRKACKRLIVKDLYLRSRKTKLFITKQLAFEYALTFKISILSAKYTRIIHFIFRRLVHYEIQRSSRLY